MLLKIKRIKFNMRAIHRYLGYFLAGIMFVYSLSGIVLIYRDTDVFKLEKQIEKEIDPEISVEKLGRALRIRNLKITKTENDIIFFDEGTFNSKTGIANYKSIELPFILKKLTHLHKATTEDPLYWLNIFFGLSLMFFVVSAFWMYRPKTTIFRKGILFALAGILLTLALLFI